MATKKELENKIESLEDRIEELEQNSFTHPLQKRQKDALKNTLKDGVEMGTGGYLDLGSMLFTSDIVNANTSAEVDRGFILAGRNRERTINNEGDNTQLQLEHHEGTTGSTNWSFFYGLRPPLYFNNGFSVTAGESTLTDSTFNWDTNELAGAYLVLKNSSNIIQEVYQIVSNTATEITIDGTWDSSHSNANYGVLVPVYLGSAEYPWRRLYVGEDIRLGFGSSGGDQVTYIKWGTGSPEGSVTANVGSLFLRKDGGSGTTLYVKESGTGNTGWVAK